MNVLDTAKEKARELADKATDKASDLSGPAGDALNSAKTAVAHGLDGASKFVDEKTGGKYASAIHTGVDKAKGFLGQGDQAADQGEKSPEADQQS
ncbi:antitoxin, partial [Actinospica durhamensis]